MSAPKNPQQGLPQNDAPDLSQNRRVAGRAFVPMSGSFSDIFIRRPVMTILLTVFAIVFGVLAYVNLPVNDLPAVDYPVIRVRVQYPGASPTTMANNVASPLEKQFMQIPGLDLVTSSSTVGNCNINLQFDLSKGIDAAATDVQAAIQRASSSLPVDLPSPPTFEKTNPNDQAVIYLALSSQSLTDAQVTDYAQTQLAQQISTLAGVSKVDVYGSKSALRIKADPSALDVRNMTMEDLAAAIRRGTSYQGAGQFDGLTRTFLLQPQAQLDSAEDYRNLVIATEAGAKLRVRDVAEVVDSVEDERMSRTFWVRGATPPASSAILAVFRLAGANAVEVAKSVRDLTEVVKHDLPGSVTLTPMYDRSATIVRSVNEVKETLLIAFFLVVIVIFVFLGRAVDTMIPVVALPLSLLLTFIVMQTLGYSFNNLTLMALTLAIGFLVDDAIVFLENVVRRMEMGETAMQASFNSAKEISFTIVSMTLSLAAVFIPLVFMPGLMGRIFREFSITIIVAIVASGLVSLTLTPLMCARMLGTRDKKTWMERMVGGFFKSLAGAYGRSLYWFLDHKFVSLLLWFVCLAGTVWLFLTLPKGFMPVGDSGFMRGVFQADEGTSPAQMHRYQEQVNALLEKNEAIDKVMTLAGAGRSFGASQALLLTFLKPVGERPPIRDVATETMAELNSVPGIKAFLRPEPVLQISVGGVSKNQGQFAYAISGVNPQSVYDAAEKLLAEFEKSDQFATVSSDYFRRTPSLDIEILRDQASSYGISAERIENLIRNAYSQNYVYLIKKPEDQYRVILETKDDVRMNPEDLGLLNVRTDDGTRTIPLDAVARWKTTLDLQSVNHIGQFTAVTLFFNLKPGVPVGGATDYIETTAQKMLPLGVQGRFLGEAEVFQDAVRGLTILIFFAIFVMYVILGILYESFVHPLTVLSSLPVATVGGLATLWLFNAELSLYAFIGVFMLMGIVKKNGIMMIDFAIQRLAEGRTAKEAAHEACIERFRPILMTTLAALMGALPLAFGHGADAESRRPPGIGPGGGIDRFPIHHALCHPGPVSLPGSAD